MKCVINPLRSLSPWLLSSLMAVGWAHAQPSPGTDIRESTDPSRAAEVEQKARALGDTVSPAGSSDAGTSTDGSTSGGSTPGAAGTSASETSGGVPDTNSGASATSGRTSGTSDAPGGGAGKSGPESEEMGGTQQLQRPGNERFTEPTQPAR